MLNFDDFWHLEKNLVKVCLHSSCVVLNSFWFDELFQREFQSIQNVKKSGKIAKEESKTQWIQVLKTSWWISIWKKKLQEFCRLNFSDKTQKIFEKRNEKDGGDIYGAQAMLNVLPVRRMTKIFKDFYGSADSEKTKLLWWQNLLLANSEWWIEDWLDHASDRYETRKNAEQNNFEIYKSQNYFCNLK